MSREEDPGAIVKTSRHSPRPKRPGPMAGFALAVIIALAAAAPPALAQFERYQPGTLAGIIEIVLTDNTDLRDRNAWGDFNLFGPGFSVEARLTYSGQTRPLSASKAQAVLFWLRSIQRQSVMELFEVEVLFAEAGTEYWMPAQSQLLPYMDAELRAGSPVDVAAQLVRRHRRTAGSS